MKIIIVLVVFLMSFTCSSLVAQVFPHDGDALHYRLIGFSFPKQEKATRYTLEIFEYHTEKDGSTETKKLLEKTDTINRIIATVPSFDKKYMWRVKYLKKNRVIHTTRYYYFSTKPNPFSDTSVTRVVILDSASLYKDMLVFFDNTRTLYDMNGQAVWFLPEIAGATNNQITGIRDLKMTGEGTITFLTDNNVFEIDYHGNVLWRGPNDGTVSGDSIERYHHQFDKLPDGHYMAAGISFAMRKIPDYVDTNVYKGRNTEIRNDGPYTLINCGTLIEYDSTGKVVWSWNTCDHLADADIFTPGGDNQIHPATHMNGFWLDKEKGIVYTSHRNISRIIKAEYPSGKTIAHYGEDYTHDGRILGDGLFYSQHNCRLGKDGNLYLFNNNVRLRSAKGEDHTGVSTVLILKEPENRQQQPEKVWKFACNIDAQAKPLSVGGGGVQELSGGELLVCMGASHRNFIVTRDKKIAWNVLSEIKTQEGAWMPSGGYRVSAVEAKDIRKLLFPGK